MTCTCHPACGQHLECHRTPMGYHRCEGPDMSQTTPLTPPEASTRPFVDDASSERQSDLTLVASRETTPLTLGREGDAGQVPPLAPPGPPRPAPQHARPALLAAQTTMSYRLSRPLDSFFRPKASQLSAFGKPRASPCNDTPNEGETTTARLKFKSRPWWEKSQPASGR